MRGESNELRGNQARARDRLRAADHSFERSVVVLADVFEELGPGTPSKEKSAGPRRGIGARIVDSRFVSKRIEVEPREAFDQMQLLRMRRSFPVDPEFFIEADGVHHQTVAFPAAHGMAVVTGFQVLRVRASVHVNGSERVRAADIEDVDPIQFRKIDELDTVRRDELSRPARDLAARMRFIALKRRFPRLVQRPGPWLKRHIFDFDVVRQVRVGIRRVHTLRIDCKLDDPRWCPYALFARRRT